MKSSSSKFSFNVWYIKILCILLWFSDGELSTQADVRDAFMKQKHRMLWERDNGPVGDKYLQEEMEKAKAREDISVKYKDRIAVRHLSRIFWS